MTVLNIRRKNPQAANIQAESAENGIYIMTPDNQKIYPKCVVSNNVITVYPPSQTGYIEDAKYVLHIQTSMKSKGGNHLSSERVIPLYILNDYAVWNY